MPWYIATVGGKVCVWSSIVDAPVSRFADTIEELGPLVGWKGPRPIGNLERMSEAEAVSWNRAGEDETTLDADGLLMKYRKTTPVPCANCRKPCPPYGGDAGTLCRDCLIALRERLADEHVRQVAQEA